jgi:hypothetical protein
MTLDSGATLDHLLNAAFVLNLQPMQQAKFALPPERQRNSGELYGAMVSFNDPPPHGLYQVTLSEDAWLDVSQGGDYVKSLGSTGRRDGLRKSIRFLLIESPVSIQVSGVASAKSR